MKLEIVEEYGPPCPKFREYADSGYCMCGRQLHDDEINRIFDYMAWLDRKASEVWSWTST